MRETDVSHKGRREETMDCVQRVRKAIHFDCPDRFPYDFDDNRIPHNGLYYGGDMIWVNAAQRVVGGNISEWGVKYEVIEGSNTFGEPKVFPLENRDSLEGYRIPDFSEDWRYEELIGRVKKNAGEKYVLGMLPHGIFQPMIDLFGFLEFCVKTVLNEPMVDELCEKLTDSAIRVCTKMASCGVNGIITIDDTAMQDRHIIDMRLFEKIFTPRFKRLYEHCHGLGMDTFIHSCGYTIGIIDSLIDAGLDVLNIDQQYNMGLERLSELYKGKVCFYCPLDIQRTPGMDDGSIALEVQRLVGSFACETGGFIAKTYPMPLSVSISDEYMRAMTDEFKRLALMGSD